MRAATVREWQELSLLDLAVEVEPAFMAVLESIPPRTKFTVNEIRSRLDAIGVDPSMRGGLFNRAIAAGLIEPVKVSAWGVDYDVRVPSTGSRTHRATVRLYRRRGPAP